MAGAWLAVVQLAGRRSCFAPFYKVVKVD